MEIAIKNRIIRLANTYSIIFLTLLEVFAIFFAYTQKPVILIILVSIYIFIPFTLNYKNNTKYSWGVSRGIYIAVDKIFKRNGLIGFYLSMYILCYTMGFSLILTNHFVGMITILLLFFGKISIYAVFYQISKYEKYYPAFDNSFL